MASVTDGLRGVKTIMRPDGSTSYQITVSRGIDPRTGKQRRRYETFTPLKGMKKAEIVKEIERIRFELGAALTNTNTLESRQSFSKFAADLIDSRELSGKFKHRTADSYRYLLKTIDEDFGNCSLNAVTPSMIEAFCNRLRRNGAHNGMKYATPRPSLNKTFEQSSIKRCDLKEITKVSNYTIGRVLHGERVTAEIAEKIAAALNKKIDDLFRVETKQTTLSERTIQLYVHFIGGVFQAAYRRGIIAENPVNRADRIEPDITPAEFLDLETMHKVLAAVEKEPLRWQVIVHLLALTGARRGEIAALRWESINLEDGMIKIDHSLSYTRDRGIFLDSTKTRHQRTVKIPAALVKLLKRYRAEQNKLIMLLRDSYNDQGFLFTQDNGNPSNPESITLWLNRFAKRNGFDGVHAHAFRHSAASYLIANGIDVVTVAAMLGHADASTTERVYAHVIEETKVRASECLTAAIYKHA